MPADGWHDDEPCRVLACIESHRSYRATLSFCSPVVMGNWPYQQTNEVEFKYLKSQITSWVAIQKVFCSPTFLFLGR